MVLLTQKSTWIFQSTPPVWEATYYDGHLHPLRRIFQSTPPVWEATASEKVTPTLGSISIHASRVGGDFNAVNLRRAIVISIHASRVGGDRS